MKEPEEAQAYIRSTERLLYMEELSRLVLLDLEKKQLKEDRVEIQRVVK